MRERLKRIFILFMAAAVLLGTAPSTAFTALADEKETENEDLEIPKVFHKDDDNEVVRIVIGKTPLITIGKSLTISIAVKNTPPIQTGWRVRSGSRRRPITRDITMRSRTRTARSSRP